MSTPETLTAAQRARMLNIPERGTMNMSKAERATLEQVMANFDVGADVPDASAGLGADADMSFAVLPIDQIEPYRYNPRTGINPRYEEIKASIRVDGITNMLTVTRRDKHSKYTTYGGGNTRLLIAKELYAEGDKRFAQLQVVVKAWPGDAQIITAQLAENENRGDITFWEKAHGVQYFRVEFEKETGKSISSAALHAELKKRGLDYGLKTIQNFAFSIENLAPIGKWLTAKEVNETIRPAYSSLQALAERLGKGGGQAREAFNAVLQKHSKTLESATQPAELDALALLADWQAAFAKLLDTDVEQLQAMLAALKADANINSKTLRQVQAAAPQARDEACESARDPGPIAPAFSSTHSARQPFKQTMRDDTYYEAQNDDVVPQAPLSKKEAQPNLNGLAAPIPPHPEPSMLPSQSERLLAEIKDLLRRINLVVPLHDVICEYETMPFGFIMDFPPSDDWATAGEVQVSRPNLRAALWIFLVSISGQMDKRVTLPPKDDGIAFSRELAHDMEALRTAFEKCGVGLSEKGAKAMPVMELGGVSSIFADPDLTTLIIKLLDAIEKLRAADPERAPYGFEWQFV